MDGPKLTQERLRHYLDSNQPMREGLCLALLPILGPYTQEKPRRPNGGPDGGRDIEAIYQGVTLVWGAVGFQNGGGADEPARRQAEDKFRSDLDRALAENRSLSAFVFFTNVDLTPTRIDNLKAYAHTNGVAVAEIFDMERLRHALDSPEGLIARVQYLEIPMSPTEQAALVGKFGSQLQNAITARFDRVERTLGQMERFLDLQKPILRLDVYIELLQVTTSAMIGNEAIRLLIHGLDDLSKTFSFLCVNEAGHRDSGRALVTGSHTWSEDDLSKVVSFRPSISPWTHMMGSWNELSITTWGHRVRIADLTILEFEAFCTDGIFANIKQIAVDANGYELFNYSPNAREPATALKWPQKLALNAIGRPWVRCVNREQRNMFFNPPMISTRFEPLRVIT